MLFTSLIAMKVQAESIDQSESFAIAIVNCAWVRVYRRVPVASWSLLMMMATVSSGDNVGAPATVPAPPTMVNGLTEEEEKKLQAIIEKLKQQCVPVDQPLTREEVVWILNQVGAIFSSQPSLVEFDAPISICGDLHGQFQDLLRLFNLCGWSPGTRYLFLGDYVDRGDRSLETVTLLFALKVQSPNDFYTLRGNHETRAMNRVFGFREEIMARYDEALYEHFNSVFEWMPISALVADRILCMHGGISPDLNSLDEIRNIQRPFAEPPDSGLVTDLLWSDPDETVVGWGPNSRAISYVFGADAVIDVCDRLDLDLIARAHQVVYHGFEFFADEKLITLFSAPDYCNMFTNSGGVLCINDDLSCQIRQVKSRNR